MTVKAIEVYEILKEIGLKEDKAEKVIDFVQEAAERKIEQEIKGLVTNDTFLKETSKIREDMALNRGEFLRETAKIKEEVGLTREEFLKEISRVREDMSNMKAEIIKWNVGTIIAVASIVAAIVKFIR